MARETAQSAARAPERFDVIVDRDSSRHSGLPPGPRAPSWFQALGFWNRPLPYFERCRARYGNRFTLRLPTAPPFIGLSDPVEIKEVFMAPADVLHPGAGSERVLWPFMGANSVILLDEGAHMEQRKLLLPALHGEKMQRLDGAMREIAEREIASWPRGTPIELHHRFQRLTLAIIVSALFGLERGPRFEMLRDKVASTIGYGDSFVSLLTPAQDSRLLPLFGRAGPFAAFKRDQRVADELIFEVIDERRREGSDGDDILTMLLEARHDDGTPMSDQELRDEMMTLMVAGHETTASTLAWAFARLPHYPDVLERLVEEIDAGDDDAYLTATIYEVMRRRPVLPTTGPRLAVKPFETSFWSYPADVLIVPNTYLVHHDPDIYDDPYAFRPERFLDKPPGTYTWIPFGGGRRRCVGASFTMIEMKIVMATMLAVLEVQPGVEGLESARRRSIAVQPSHGTRVILRDRARVWRPVPAAG